MYLFLFETGSDEVAQAGFEFSNSPPHTPPHASVLEFQVFALLPCIGPVVHLEIENTFSILHSIIS